MSMTTVASVRPERWPDERTDEDVERLARVMCEMVYAVWLSRQRRGADAPPLAEEAAKAR